MKLPLVICLLFASSFSVAAVPSSPAVPGKARIVITSEPLGGVGVTADVDINGQRVASIGVEDTYSGVFAPGKMVVTVRGGNAEFNADANKEYRLEIALVPSRSGFFLFGLAGAMAMSNFTITLKETKETQVAGTQSETAKESPVVVTQVPEQIKQIPQNQSEPIRTEKVPEKVGPLVPVPSVIATTSKPVDFNAEANKAARILGCKLTDLKVAGVESGNIQYAVACEDARTLNLSCDPTGLCLQKVAETRTKL